MSNAKANAKTAMTEALVVEAFTLPTKSAQIRFLHAGGKSRADIVAILNMHYDKPTRYQHVRNVLVTVLTGKKTEVQEGTED